MIATPYFFNDVSMTMTLLVEADNQELIDLLGITITGGNKFIAESTNTVLWNLEQLVECVMSIQRKGNEQSCKSPLF